MNVTAVSRLDSGYWHVQLGRERFIQWPTGHLPRAEDCFHINDEDVEAALALATEAVSLSALKERG